MPQILRAILLEGIKQICFGWQVDVAGESCGGVGVGSNVESLHLSELVPLLDIVLVAFDVFPFKGDN